MHRLLSIVFLCFISSSALAEQISVSDEFKCVSVSQLPYVTITQGDIVYNNFIIKGQQNQKYSNMYFISAMYSSTNRSNKLAFVSGEFLILKDNKIMEALSTNLLTTGIMPNAMRSMNAAIITTPEIAKTFDKVCIKFTSASFDL